MSSDLPDGWTWARLEDLVAAEPRAITDGPFGSKLKTAHYTDTGPRVIRLQNIGDGVFRHEDAHVSEEHYMSLIQHSVREGDLVVASLGETLPRACLVPRWVPPAIVKADCIRVRLHPDLDSSYINFALQRPSLRHQTATQIKGVGRPRLGLKGIRNLAVPVAPLSEQQQVVAAIEEHFSRLDAADTALTAAQRRLDALRRSAAAELFDRPDWSWTTLGEIAELKGGVTKDSKREADPGYVEYPYLRVANVQRGFFDLAAVTTIRADRHKAEKLVLQHGDILFNEGGDRDKLGRGWVWEGQIENCIHQNHVFRARLTNGGFDPYFISMHANTWGQRWFETHGKQTTNLASINLATLRTFPVPAPSLDEQRAVVAELQSIMSRGDRLRTDINQAVLHSKTLRRSILSTAFSGQLVPQDPTDEAASVLLERIAASRSTKPNRRASARQVS